MNTCTVCGKTVSGRAKTCSSACRQAAYRRRDMSDTYERRARAAIDTLKWIAEDPRARFTFEQNAAAREALARLAELCKV
jgi:predicted nucleic acid-binding Zn ribbon protein